MFALSGGSLNHSLIAADMIALLRSQKPEACRVFTSDLQIKVAATGLLTYPTAVCFAGTRNSRVIDRMSYSTRS